MTIHIKGGRTMWQGPNPSIAIYEQFAAYLTGDPLYKMDNAEFDLRTDRSGGEFQIQTRHENGTDFEHDAARIAYFAGHGAQFRGLSGPRLEFTGVLFEARHYAPDFDLVPGADTSFSRDNPDIDVCNDERCGEPHLLMPYMPPTQFVNPQPIIIEIDFSGANE